jgi:hypothetical protein
MMDCETQNERTAVAEYIADMAAELAVMAAWAEHEDLARLLEMARLEAERLCGRAPNADQPAADIPELTQLSIEGAPNVILLSALRSARR